jgi:YhcH/YjgK/YiaL family protein
MITDKLENAYMYFPCHPEFRAAFEFLRKTDFQHTCTGRYNIDGDDAFALVQEIETKPVDQCVFEAHRQYIDIQYIISYEEKIGYCPVERLNPSDGYSDSKDSITYDGAGDIISLRAGYFAIFFPHEGHMPGISLNEKHGISKKVVLKVRCQ